MRVGFEECRDCSEGLDGLVLCRFVLFSEKINGSDLEGDVLEVQTESDSPGTGRAVEGVEDW